MKNKILCLLAGYPGTGKTHLYHIINKKIGGFCHISLDLIKEELFDQGFDNLLEKSRIEEKAQQTFFNILKQNMELSCNIISDYPFSYKQKSIIDNLIEKHGYTAITIRLVAELNILYARQRERDLDQTRHPGHILSAYKKGMKIGDRLQSNRLLSKEEFFDRCLNRGYAEFQIGTLIQIEVTDYSKINYTNIINAINNVL